MMGSTLTRVRLSLIDALAGLLLLQGCGTPVPETRVFTVDADYGFIQGKETVHPVTLQVQSFTSSDVYSDRRIAWRENGSPYQVRLMDNNLWGSAPPRLAQDQLAECIADSGLYRNVLTDGVAVQIDQVMNGELRRLEFLTDGQTISGAVLEINLVLTGRRPRELMWQGSFRYDVPVAANSADAAVDAVIEAFRQFCTELVGTLEAVPPQ